MDFRSYNHVTLVGRVGTVGELKIGKESQVHICQFSMCTEEVVEKRRGEKKDHYLDWHWVTAFGVLADFVNEYLCQGMLVLVDGKNKERKWFSGEQRHRKYEVHARNIVLIGKKFERPEDKEEGEEAEGEDESEKKEYEEGDEHPF